MIFAVHLSFFRRALCILLLSPPPLPFSSTHSTFFSSSSLDLYSVFYLGVLCRCYFFIFFIFFFSPPGIGKVWRTIHHLRGSDESMHKQSIAERLRYFLNFISSFSPRFPFVASFFFICQEPIFTDVLCSLSLSRSRGHSWTARFSGSLSFVRFPSGLSVRLSF